MATNIFDDIDSGTLISVNVNGIWVLMTAATFLTWLQDNVVVGSYVSQYEQPSATGFTVALVSDSQDRHLILAPIAAYANGTFTLPAATTCVDGQKVLVTTTQAITTVTFNLNGASTTQGAPTTLAANAFFTLKYDQPSKNWIRVG